MSRRWSPAQFWTWFREHEARFRALVLPEGDALLGEVYEHLQQVEPGVGLLISEQPDEEGRFEFVLTTHGDPAHLAGIDRLANAAPEIPGWLIVAGQPARGFEFTHHVHDRDVVLDPREMRFDPLACPGEHALGLRVVTRPHPRLTVDDLRLAVDRILLTGLGDRGAAQIEHVEVAFEDPPPAELIPLVDLARFIAWRDRRIEDPRRAASPPPQAPGPA